MDAEISDIIKTRDIIRKKFNAFRHGEAETSSKLEKQFKPVTDPLKAILKAQVKEPPDEEVIDEPKPDESEPEFDETPRDDLYDVLEKNYSPQVSGYLYDKLTSSAFAGRIYDEAYGVRRDTGTNGWAIGNRPVSFDRQGNLMIDDATYSPDPGFLELIFKKNPQGYTAQDLDRYREVLERTDAHKRFYIKDQPVNANKSQKYKAVVAKLFPPESKQRKKKKGSGIAIPPKGPDQVFVPQNPKERVFVYWDDPNELVERLALLMASKNAGHTGHDREILSIAEELREAGYIE